jgi:hypothetical protein
MIKNSLYFINLRTNLSLFTHCSPRGIPHNSAELKNPHQIYASDATSNKEEKSENVRKWELYLKSLI